MTRPYRFTGAGIKEDATGFARGGRTATDHGEAIDPLAARIRRE